MTKIEWTDKTWNPIVGCRKVSLGCQNCYAEKMARRLAAMGNKIYQNVIGADGKWNGVQAVNGLNVLDAPLHRKKPTIWFVNSMSDLFLTSGEFNWMAANHVWDIASKTRQHTYQILTKHPGNMKKIVSGLVGKYGVLPNIWLGVSVENQEYADKRIPILLQIPAAVRFVSAEPLLGAIDFKQSYPTVIDWIIVGGESGSGARPINPDWVRSIRDQCLEANIPFFFKQWGAFAPVFNSYTNDGGYDMQKLGKKKAGCKLNGCEWKQMPGKVSR